MTAQGSGRRPAHASSAAAGRRLRELPRSVRALLLAFVVVVSAGLVAAHLNLSLQHAGRDGEPGVSRRDIVLAFHGDPDRTLLAAKVDGGSMERYVPLPTERDLIVSWANGGGGDAGFDEVADVLERRCVRCHNPRGEMSSVSFAESRRGGAVRELVAKSATLDRGMSSSALMRSTHAHLFGMAVLFLAVGLLVLRTDLGARCRVALALAPFVAVILDIGSWWLTRWSPAWSWGVYVGGALLGISASLGLVRCAFELVTPRAAPNGARPAVPSSTAS